MADIPQSVSGRPSIGAWITGLAGSRRFQAFAARVPGLRAIARAEGAAIFDVVQGFVRSQTLVALVELRVLHRLSDGPATAETLAPGSEVPVARMQILLQSAAAIGLLRRRRDGSFALTLRGASILGVPGLEAMIRHHRAFYADMSDPVALLRGARQTELAQFWPYVFGAEGARDPEVTSTYSDLMAQSQTLVAEDTLRLVDFGKVRRLLDIGGGTGAFLTAVGLACPAPRLELFDLPVVVEGAATRFARAGLAARCAIHPGSFRDDPLPQGADAISLIRVLYDHNDSTVANLLASVHGALPPGGRLVISEPMSGGGAPDPITDVYFAFYTLAMQTGRTRSAVEISRMLTDAGFCNIQIRNGFRPYVTSVITAERGMG
ncbi:MAG: methyltransferase domain-containing protein [Rhodobacteraceae bacterium]|nr:methyltransferase domain-containing protein [Paracoccaceae bacterium]